MKKIKILSVLFVSVCCVACNNKSGEAKENPKLPVYEKLKQSSWLIGSWQGVSPDGVFGEQWEMGNDSVFNGKGYFVVGKDTVSSEVLRLMQTIEGFFYEPTVKNQNDGKTVRFTSVQISDNNLLFENPAHDFPQKIRYVKITPDSIVASISGMLEGKESTQIFPMSRVK